MNEIITIDNSQQTDLQIKILEKQQAEKKLRSETYQGKKIYVESRDIIATIARPYIDLFLNQHIQPQIIEIGCGEGEGIKKLIQNHHSLLPSTIHATALSPIPNHTTLTTLGIHMHHGIIVEALPNEWQETFDVVLASVVMQWTEIPKAVSEIARILKKGGYFLGADIRRVTGEVEHHAKIRHMQNILDHPLTIQCNEFIPFAFQRML